jgi:hypothetical protein
MRRPALRWAVPIGLVALAVVVAGIVTAQSGSEPAPAVTTTTAPEPDPVAVSSDAPRFTSLAQLISASDLIVRGRVTDTEPGRTFGDGTSAARITSRLVTLDVSEVLRGDAPDGELGTLLVEEEGWTAEGAPLVVDGAAPSAEGDEGIWFLVDPGDATTGALIVVNAQGRYLAEGSHLAGAAGNDPLVAQLGALSETELASRVRAGR